MSTRRIPKPACPIRELPKGPNGRRLCRWCHEEVPKGKRSFCGESCVHEWSVRRSPSYQRGHVLERDHGICDTCGLDCERLRRSVSRHWRSGSFCRFYRLYMWATQRAVTRKLAPFRQLWEMDHIKPVVEGGGECGPENLRTLCIWCHNEATAALRKRLARRTRKKKNKSKREQAKARWR